MKAITVSVASHNRLDYLQKALQSVVTQEWPTLEILVVDDGSEEETRTWLKRWGEQHPQARVHFQAQSGVGEARRVGVELASFPIIVILDSDDLLADGALSRISKAFEADPELDLLYGDIESRRSDGATSVRSYRSWRSNRVMALATLILPRLPFKHSGSAYRKETALSVGNYDASLKKKIDIDFFLKFLTEGKKVRYLPGGPLVIFHMHGDSISRNRVAGLDSWRVILHRYGPRGPLGWAMKGVKYSGEIAKVLYEKLFVK